MCAWLPALALLAVESIASPASGDDADDLVGLAVVPGTDDGVAWSTRSIQSFDGSRVLLPGTGDVAAVTAASDGTVFAIRGQDRFGVAAPNAAPVWLPTPVAGKTMGLVVIANRIAWFVETDQGVQLALTADQGRHWKVQSLPFVDEGHLELRAGGVLELDGYIYDCHGGDDSVRYRGRIGSNHWRRTRTAAETAYRGPSHYKPSDGGDGPLTGAVDTWRWRDQKEQLPDGVSVITADARGRLLGVAKRDVWRWSRAAGWQALRARR